MKAGTHIKYNSLCAKIYVIYVKVLIMFKYFLFIVQTEILFIDINVSLSQMSHYLRVDVPTQERCLLLDA